jgi:hypothetical protein
MAIVSDQGIQTRLRRWAPVAMVLAGLVILLTVPVTLFGSLFAYVGVRDFRPIFYWNMATGALGLIGLALLLIGRTGSSRPLVLGYGFAAASLLITAAGLLAR